MTDPDEVRRDWPALKRRLLAVESSGHGDSPTTNWHRNPDGPEAVAEIKRLRGDYAYPVGTKVEKPRGYPFPGTVVAAFDNLAGEPRYVVESELAPGMLHIFSGKQITRAAIEGTRDE